MQVAKKLVLFVRLCFTFYGNENEKVFEVNFQNVSDTIGQVMTIERQPSRLLEKKKKSHCQQLKWCEKMHFTLFQILFVKRTKIPSQQF